MTVAGLPSVLAAARVDPRLTSERNLKNVESRSAQAGQRYVLLLLSTLRTRRLELGLGTEVAERDAIQSALAVNDFHREQTARTLGISVRTLHYKMNHYGLH